MRRITLVVQDLYDRNVKKEKPLLLVHHRIGESRAILYDESGRPVDLIIRRWREAENRVYLGEVYEGIIRKVEKGLNAAFVEIGKGQTGFLPLSTRNSSKASLFEGARVHVRVRAEAHSTKKPVLVLVKPSENIQKEIKAETQGCFEEYFEEYLKQRYRPGEKGFQFLRLEDQQERTSEDVNLVFDEALGHFVPLENHGGLWVEPTHALTAIDIDHGRGGNKCFHQGVLQRNLEALGVIKRQIGLRRLSGLIVIDFISIHDPKARRKLVQAIKTGLQSEFHTHKLVMAPLSRFCLLEISRERQEMPLSQIMMEGQRKTIETSALEAIERLYRAGCSQRHESLCLCVSSEVLDWLEMTPVDWRQALKTELGSRFKLQAMPEFSREQTEIITGHMDTEMRGR